VILLAEHDESSLAAKKKQRQVALETPTSTPKNRVWNFFDSALGRPGVDPDLSWENATGSVQYSYKNASGQGYYYTRDHLGSVREMCSSTGTITSRMAYDPYGRTTTVSGTTLPTMQYAGYYEHAASGLSLTRYRAYDANAGRWLSRDPIGELGGLNLYGYVADDPVNMIDSIGLAPCDAELSALRQAQWAYDMAGLNQQLASLKRQSGYIMLMQAEDPFAKQRAMDQIAAANAEMASAAQARGVTLQELIAAQATYDACLLRKTSKKPWVCPVPFRTILWPAGLVPLLIPKEILDEIAPDPKHPPMA